MPRGVLLQGAGRRENDHLAYLGGLPDGQGAPAEIIVRLGAVPGLGKLARRGPRGALGLSSTWTVVVGAARRDMRRPCASNGAGGGVSPSGTLAKSRGSVTHWSRIE